MLRVCVGRISTVQYKESKPTKDERGVLDQRQTLLIYTIL